MQQELAIELVDLGDDSGKGLFESNGSKTVMRKFIILKSSQVVALVHGPVDDFPYHANLIEAYCNANEIPAHWVNKPDMVEIDDSDLTIRGGGWIEFDPIKQQLRFGGRSTAYGRFDEKLIAVVLQRAHTLKAYQVHLR